jgi:isopentenyl phosphate kinase
MPDQKNSRNKLVFLKLGGSLITEKNEPSTPRIAVLDRLAAEIAQALDAEPGLRLLVGHGSGSFGHVPAREYQTKNGVYSKRGWQGFIKVWRQAYALNRIVVEALSKKRLPCSCSWR